jgi:hypothetical protein
MWVSQEVGVIAESGNYGALIIGDGRLRPFGWRAGGTLNLGGVGRTIQETFKPSPLAGVAKLLERENGGTAISMPIPVTDAPRPC